MSKLILIRHGQSSWNKKNLFTGWVDVPLSEEGINEALRAGDVIKLLEIDIIFTSTLIRSIMTALIATSKLNSKKTPIIQHDSDKDAEWMSFDNDTEKQASIPLIQSSALNERMYGSLQGKNKAQTEQEFGKEQVLIWRRSYDVPPPSGESLQDTGARSIPYFQQEIIKHIIEGKNVLVSAHGNSLRSIIMSIEKLSKEEVLKLEIPTGKPIIYESDGQTFNKQ